jgi:peptide deformylase
MATQKILIAPHPTLRQKAKEVVSVDKKLVEHFDALHDTLLAARNPRGVGLAQPQIDHLWRAFATNLETSLQDDPLYRVFINPKIIDRSDKLVMGVNPRNADLEGCLSIPHLYGPVLRHEWTTFTFQTLNKNHELSDMHTETFYDFASRVMQHELDHLDGILFTDHILEQGQPLYQQVGDELVEVEPELGKGL